VAIGKQPELDLEGGEDSIFAEINITPLTDVFLVLVIIFMVSASASVAEHEDRRRKLEEQVAAEKRSGLEVSLPSGAAQEIDPTKASLVVTILVSGELIVNEKKVTDADLDRMFQNAFVRDKTTQVVLKADKGVQHGRVVGVMERAKRIGLTRLAIGTSAGK
jgi:biopolymer transport protein ExbD